MQAKTQDAFVVVCTIHSSPTSPQVWIPPRQLIPKTLLDTVGSLLDDPSYSDIEFVIAKQRDHSNVRTIYACKKMLRRADYFETSIFTSENHHFIYLDFEQTAVFTSSFAENAKGTTDLEITPKTTARSLDSPPSHTSIMEEFEDSDDEDEETFMFTGPNDALIESSRGFQESSLTLDENTTAYSADSDNTGRSRTKQCT
jgi:hypothetical protein